MDQISGGAPENFLDCAAPQEPKAISQLQNWQATTSTNAIVNPILAL